MTTATLLDLWDDGASETPAERGARAIRLLGLDPSSVTIGEREARLAQFYAALFGATFEGLATCPACEDLVEFAIPAGQLRTDGGLTEFSITEGEWQVRGRILSAADAAEASRQGDASRVAAELLSRSVLSASCSGAAVPASSLPSSVVDRVADALLEHDPLSQIDLELRCPNCGHEMTRRMDPPTFLWAKLDRWASQMLQEVHLLARNYGWPESTILAMSPTRRARYLDMVTG